jgi:hypothetical protein
VKKSRLKRTALTKPNFSYLRWRYFSNAGRTWREWQSRHFLDEKIQGVAQNIRDRGIVTGPAYSYLTEEGRAALKQAAASVIERTQSDEVQTVLRNGRQANDEKDYLIRVVPWDLLHPADSPLLKVALDRMLLEIVATYLGMWPRLHAVGAWLNFATDQDAKEAQLWHRDPEDMKMIKVFIYLDDVGPENGPFCYIPKTHPFSPGAGTIPIHRDKKRILDSEMLGVIPKDCWIACTGPANTMIIADTVGYHRGGKPTSGTRVLITFTYTSGTPFVERTLHVMGLPVWITHPIQNYAL